MDVVIDTHTWLKIVMVVADCVACSPQGRQDMLTDESVTLIMVGQKNVILEALWRGRRDRSTWGTSNLTLYCIHICARQGHMQGLVQPSNANKITTHIMHTCTLHEHPDTPNASPLKCQ